MTLTDNADIANEIHAGILAGDVGFVEANTSIRHGEVVLVRIGDSQKQGQPTPHGGYVVAPGAHGHHRIVGEAVTFDEKARTFDLAKAAFIVHTDRPDARHQAAMLAAGLWQASDQRELGLDETIQKVID